MTDREVVDDFHRDAARHLGRLVGVEHWLEAELKQGAVSVDAASRLMAVLYPDNAVQQRANLDKILRRVTPPSGRRHPRDQD